MDRELLRALASNCGRAYLAGARATDRPWHVDEDVVMSDLGLPGALPPNTATLLQPPVGRGQFGFSLSSAPCMVRDPGGEPPPGPPELEGPNGTTVSARL